MNGASAHPGPNAPLNNPCGNSSQPTATAEAAFKQWTNAGCPASKLLLGLPLYGYVSQSSATKLSGGYELPNVEDAAKKSDGVDADAMGNLSKWYGQQIPFKSLVASGALKKHSDGSYGGANGYTRGKFSFSLLPGMKILTLFCAKLGMVAAILR